MSRRTACLMKPGEYSPLLPKKCQQAGTWRSLAELDVAPSQDISKAAGRRQRGMGVEDPMPPSCQARRIILIHSSVSRVAGDLREPPEHYLQLSVSETTRSLYKCDFSGQDLITPQRSTEVLRRASLSTEGRPMEAAMPVPPLLEGCSYRSHMLCGYPTSTLLTQLYPHTALLLFCF